MPLMLRNTHLPVSKEIGRMENTIPISAREIDPHTTQFLMLRQHT